MLYFENVVWFSLIPHFWRIEQKIITVEFRYFKNTSNSNSSADFVEIPL